MIKAKNNLGDRMKAYEFAESKRKFIPGIPVLARLDGKCFSSFTEGLDKPYDIRLSQLMRDVTAWILEETGAVVGYTQSDEISVAWFEPNLRAQTWFDGRVQKMTSVLAAMCSAAFNKWLVTDIPEKAELMPVFDCRCWQVPTITEATNYFLWRELDATKNAVNSAARVYYSHEQLIGKTCEEMQEMLWKNHKVNFNDYPACFRRGTYLTKVVKAREFTAEDMAQLPEGHAAKLNPGLVVFRPELVERQLPPLSKIVNRVEVLFKGEDVKLASDKRTDG